MTQAKFLQDRYVKIGSIKTRYWCAGDSGSPIVLLHGAGSSIEAWSRNIHALAQSHQVYAFDMVGSGLSDKPFANYSLEYQGQFLRDFINALKLQRAAFVGHSMGASLALKLTLESPEQVEKLVLVSTFGLGREISIASRLLAAFPLIVHLSQPSPRNVKLILQQNVYNLKSVPNEWIEMRSEAFKLPGRKQAFVSFLKSNINLLGVRRSVFRPIVSSLANVTVPTLIIWGKQDKIVPVAHAHIAARQIPNAHLHVFDQCGHWAQFEHPQEFNQLVVEFLTAAQQIDGAVV
ncbi:alpha/beta fold hydrolase [Thermosynechococcaceae cyanobacterium BACA0444]|uniref:Alpha/beta fold hydrolase n=1 Tax=Pseudocalidococcus azoricus BACA0444 TaxID=2918990 RepID=A0AAE4FU75_9CYAN|nr:alpha/beta fold hydrolase [Pseudocalidococcus azoricus]MDS3862428.1 alpha/beta fold hydrolase [Pseudocalidococcus azoricus BACA0444]